MKKTLILQCPGMVCSPPVVSKCLGEAHRRLELFTLFTLHYITLNPFFFSILLVIFSVHCPIKIFQGSKLVGRQGANCINIEVKTPENITWQ